MMQEGINIDGDTAGNWCKRMILLVDLSLVLNLAGTVCNRMFLAQ